MKVLVSAALVLVGSWLAYRLARRRSGACVSETWLREQRVLASRAGVDLPRWRTPKERAEMNRKTRSFAEWEQRYGRTA